MFTSGASALRRVNVLLFAVIVSAFGLSVAPAAKAALPCSQGSVGTQFAGSTSAFSVLFFGASARVEFRNPDLCGNTYSGLSAFSAAWSMIAAHSKTTSAIAYAQSGYYEAGDATGGYQSGVNTFSQYLRRCAVIGTSCGGVGYTTAFYTAPYN